MTNCRKIFFLLKKYWKLHVRKFKDVPSYESWLSHSKEQWNGDNFKFIDLIKLHITSTTFTYVSNHLRRIQLGVQIIVHTVDLPQRHPMPPPQWQRHETYLIFTRYVQYETTNVLQIQTIGISESSIWKYYVETCKRLRYFLLSNQTAS